MRQLRHDSATTTKGNPVQAMQHSQGSLRMLSKGGGYVPGGERKMRNHLCLGSSARGSSERPEGTEIDGSDDRD